MKTAAIKLKSVTPYSQSKYLDIEPDKQETRAAFEERIWREKAHYDEEGNVFIPPMAIKFALQSAGKRLGMQVKGKGKKTYTAILTSGLSIPKPVFIGIKLEQVKRNDVLCNSDGVRGSGKRVWRYFPTVHNWEAEFEMLILDDMITEDVLRAHLEEAGKYIGIGQGRAETGNDFGRFEVVSIKYK